MNVPHTVHIVDERSPLQHLDQNVFHRVSTQDVVKSPARYFAMSSVKTAYTSSWYPPIYRNTTLLSSPSQTPSQISMENNTVVTDESHQYSDIGCQLPVDFLPPRHNFATPSRDDESFSRATKPLPSGCVHLRDSDIVCGRGAPTLVHPGNHAYRELIKKHEAAYLCCKRTDKPVIASKVLETLRGQGVRFVRRERGGSGLFWTVLGEQKAYEKVCQSLREGAPELRRKILASDARKSLHMETQHLATARDENNYSPIPCF